MKTYLIGLLIVISTIGKAQTIITDAASIIVNGEARSIIYRSDIFHIKENSIIWYSKEAVVLYYINSYTKLSENKFVIHCITNGKHITFIVDFSESFIMLNKDLMFFKTDKT